MNMDKLPYFPSQVVCTFPDYTKILVCITVKDLQNQTCLIHWTTEEGSQRKMWVSHTWLS